LSDPLIIAVVGYGGHVRKNIERLFDGDGTYRFGPVVVRDRAGYATRWPDMAARFTADYGAVLADPAVGAVYIATPTASHADLARAALAAGKHVWCEKPMTLSAPETEALVADADARGLMCAEISVYRYHAQFAAVRELLADKAAAGERLVAARARFTIPELPADDMRYNPALGGGALLDVGYYPLSLAPALFGAPREIAAAGYHCPARGVDLSGSAALVYGNFAVHVLWAIGAAYSNELELDFTRSRAVVPRVFSKPPGLATEIAIIAANGSPAAPIAVPGDDQFANLFARFAHLVSHDDRAAFAALGAEAVEAARLLDRVRAAIPQG